MAGIVHAASDADAVTPSRGPLPTNAPASLGAVAAGLQAVELAKLIAAVPGAESLAGSEVLLDLRFHTHSRSRMVARKNCRFNHRIWPIESLVPTNTSARDLTLADLIAAADIDIEALREDSVAVTAEAGHFVGAVRCPACGWTASGWRIADAASSRMPDCRYCSRRTAGDSQPMAELTVSGREIGGAPIAALSLDALGAQAGDVFCLQAPGQVARYLEIRSDDADDDASRCDHNPGATVIVAGCGNIGSHFVPLAARIPAVRKIILVDPDHYEPHNLAGQSLRGRDLFRSKVEVQAEVCREIRSDLLIETVRGPIESLPLGRFRNAVAVSCLDSRIARQALNEKAWRAGATWIDAAVDGPGLFVRAALYRPSRQSACLECGWDDDDYAALETVTACAESAVNK